LVPEGIEIEIYRRAALPCVGLVVASVSAPDDWYLKGGTTAASLTVLVGAHITNFTRTGKLLRAHMSDDSVLGLRFGMTGRPVINQTAAIDDLLYTSNDYKPEWVRFALTFTDGSVFEMVDPRRLGGVELDPGEKLGPDLSTITMAQLQRALRTTKAPLKAALLQQDRVAGIGNLLVDEILWQCSLAPTRIAGELSDDERKLLAHMIRATFTKLLRRGGSHLGDHVAQRTKDGVCTRVGCNRKPFRRETIGGRTTYWCPAHQS
jgi:formamidopyrimidine-DNA glycosylase